MATIPLNEEQLARVYNAIWQNIAREDTNVSNRIGWAIALTSGQFTAISFMVSSITGDVHGTTWPIIVGLAVIGISVLGVYFCYRTKVGVEAAHDQAAYLRIQFAQYAPEFDRLKLPRPFGEGKSNQPGRKNSHVFPIALLCFWTLIFVSALGGTIWVVAEAAVQAGSGATAPTPNTTSVFSIQLPVPQMQPQGTGAASGKSPDALAPQPVPQERPRRR